GCNGVAGVEGAERHFAKAGHPSAVHVRRNYASAEKLDGEEARGPAMRIFSSVIYPTTTRSIAKGDLIMLFTDGLFEVEDVTGAFFNEEQLRATANRHAAVGSGGILRSGAGRYPQVFPKRDLRG